MHKSTGARDPAAAFPLPRARDDAKDRREATRAGIGIAVVIWASAGRQVADAVAGQLPEAGSLTWAARAAA